MPSRGPEPDGTVVPSSVAGEQAFGAIVSPLLPAGDDGAPGDRETTDLSDLVSTSPEGTIAVLLAEQRCTSGLADAMGRDGGIGSGAALLIPQRTALVDTQVSPMEEATRSVAAAHAAGADAWLRALTAQAAADDAVTEVTEVAEVAKVGFAAAAEALWALMEAALVERAVA